MAQRRGRANSAAQLPHGVDHAAQFDAAAVAGTLENAAVVDSNGRVDRIAAQARNRTRMRSSSGPTSRL